METLALLFYIGWSIVALGSQLLPLNDTIIEVYRDMNVQNQRLGESIMVGINIIIAIMLYYKKKFRLEDILYLFLVGTLVEFALEFTLTISGIRLEQGTWLILTMIINTLIEFNLGIIIMYLLWIPFKIKKQGEFYFPLSYRDLKFIKTDFDLVASTIRRKDINEKQMKIYSELYSKQDFLSDLDYYSKTYRLTISDSDIESLVNKYWK